jgi:hypothetical protein
MVAIVRTEWSGTSGGPGLTQLCTMGLSEYTAANAQAAVNAVRAFWVALAPDLPDELRLSVQPVVDIYNDLTGELQASHTAAVAPSVVAGAAAGSYIGGAGAKVSWNTGSIHNGRRVRGSTFIVPLSNAVFTATGTVGTSFITSTNTAANTMIAALTTAATPMVVWSRPKTPAGLPAVDGAVFLVSSGSVGAKSAILRGRRD